MSQPHLPCQFVTGFLEDELWVSAMARVAELPVQAIVPRDDVLPEIMCADGLPGHGLVRVEILREQASTVGVLIGGYLAVSADRSLIRHP